MAVARTSAAQPSVLAGDIVSVEADISRGLHSFSIVGLASRAVEEARDRVNSAVKNSGFRAPKSANHKVTISLSPADLKKEGPRFDLPIALAYLVAAGEISEVPQDTLCIGELSLAGALKSVRGVLPCARAAARDGYRSIIVPAANAEEAALVPDIAVFGAPSLRSVIDHLDKQSSAHAPLQRQAHRAPSATWSPAETRFEDVRGQESAKRGLIIAAAGRHNALMIGPPGTGKTMLARAFRGILPPLSPEEALDVTAIHSVAGTLEGSVLSTPPFRAPHHSASHTSLVGGGSPARPGEVTLAHRGVLFLDELPEFDRRSIDALRQPLEERAISITRAAGSVRFPADVILLAAMNPSRGRGETHPTELVETIDQSYHDKLSGPILDRIDLWLSVPHIPYAALETRAPAGDETGVAREQVHEARLQQHARLEGRAARTNGEMSARDIEETAVLGASAAALLRQAAGQLSLSPRSYHRVIKVARTIADLAGEAHIQEEHLLEALQYRVRV